ncbi:hypothetical protein PORY_000765 [Pneumocystis oryctolagi]|uniref:Uncharacterized protein n=1 Tax=Pneumocystis oryctolagi TaxID=42067 RepID=A0ACB7CEB7_9ASCO|nr:hypothetical protein PORY_000765 [Pneumocystis oryctolagi]
MTLRFDKISVREALSGIFGAISLASWIITIYPQLYENYRRKSGDSISLLFLWLWILGDAFSLVGSIWGKLIYTIIVIQVYYCVMDLALIFQIFYYRRRSYLRLKVKEKTFKRNTPLQALICLLTVLVFGILGWIITVAVGGVKKPDTQMADSVGFLVLGYIGTALYLIARIPQIIKNFKEKSVEGLSILFFVFTFVANITYATSILLIDLSHRYIIINMPWLLGSLGTISLDMTIFFQFVIYGRQKKEQKIKQENCS